MEPDLPPKLREIIENFQSDSARDAAIMKEQQENMAGWATLPGSIKEAAQAERVFSEQLRKKSAGSGVCFLKSRAITEPPEHKELTAAEYHTSWNGIAYKHRLIVWRDSQWFRLRRSRAYWFPFLYNHSSALACNLF